MKGLPVRRTQFNVPKFVAWLADNGAEIGVPTNAYEVVRYRAFEAKGNRATTHIVYAKESGLLTFTGASKEHYSFFLAGWRIEGKGVVRKSAKVAAVQQDVAGLLSATGKRRAKLRARDGDACWYCAAAMDDDATVEHLVPQSRGGGNDLANLVLAHARCNLSAGDMALTEKVELRARLRSGVTA